jgi:hypothetical protein
MAGHSAVLAVAVREIRVSVGDTEACLDVAPSNNNMSIVERGAFAKGVVQSFVTAVNGVLQKGEAFALPSGPTFRDAAGVIRAAFLSPMEDNRKAKYMSWVDEQEGEAKLVLTIVRPALGNNAASAEPVPRTKRPRGPNKPKDKVRLHPIFKCGLCLAVADVSKHELRAWPRMARCCTLHLGAPRWSLPSPNFLAWICAA